MKVELSGTLVIHYSGRAVGGQCFGMGWGADLIGLLHCPPYIYCSIVVELASCQFQYMLGRAGCPLYCYAHPVEWASW
ncbi:hypothetical protein [Moorena producens]|uniref:hypothetical protein n=1 Tax=Moorena producens TaxID=1155739 RepID=UPI00030426A4|nr:hypothetical protein [Moorena producens]